VKKRALDKQIAALERDLAGCAAARAMRAPWW